MYTRPCSVAKQLVLALLGICSQLKVLGALDRFHSLGLRELCPNVFAALHRSSPPYSTMQTTMDHDPGLEQPFRNETACSMVSIYTVYSVYISGYITLVPIIYLYNPAPYTVCICMLCIQAFSWPQDRVRALHLVHSNFSTILRHSYKQGNAIHPSISLSCTANLHQSGST